MRKKLVVKTRSIFAEDWSQVRKRQKKKPKDKKNKEKNLRSTDAPSIELNGQGIN